MPFILQTDASERGVGAVLSQPSTDSDHHPVAYFSKKLLSREERYSTIEKECLAVKLGIEAFHFISWDVHLQFKLITVLCFS